MASFSGSSWRCVAWVPCAGSGCGSEVAESGWRTGTPTPIGSDASYQAAGIGPDSEVIWAGADPFDPTPQLCAGLTGRGGTDHSQWVPPPHSPTVRPGAEGAACARCHTA